MTKIINCMRMGKNVSGELYYFLDLGPYSSIFRVHHVQQPGRNAKNCNVKLMSNFMHYRSNFMSMQIYPCMANC